MTRRRGKLRTKKFGGYVLALAGALTPFALARFPHWVPLEVSHLSVQGSSILPPTSPGEARAVRQGDRLFGRWLDDAVIRFKSDPRVKRVAVLRNSTGEVRVDVTERKAAALANFDHLYYVDRAAHILAPARTTDAQITELVVLTGPWSGRAAESAASNMATRKDILEGLDLLAAFVGNGISQKDLSELHLDPALGWILYRVGSRSRIIIGRSDFAEKAKRLTRVMKEMDQNKGSVREIDLDIRDRVIIKLKAAT